MTVFLCGFGGRFVMRPCGFARLFFGGRTQFAHTLSHLMSKNNVCLSIFFWCAKENARKRKAHEPFPLDTRPPPRKHALGNSFLLARHMRPQTRFCSDSAGLCGRLCRPSPRRSRKVPPFALRLVGVGAPICSWDFFGGRFVNRPTGFGVFFGRTQFATAN